jgi:hypothetical protein
MHINLNIWAGTYICSFAKDFLKKNIDYMKNILEKLYVRVYIQNHN